MKRKKRQLAQITSPRDHFREDEAIDSDIASKEHRLDPRGVFLITTPIKFFIWIGNQVCKSAWKSFVKAAEEHIHMLQKYEKGPLEIENLAQGAETLEFWDAFGLSSPPLEEEKFRLNPKWTNWFTTYDEESRMRSARSQKSKLAYAERDEYEDKPALFVYPFYNEHLFLLDLDDLKEEGMAVLCDRSKSCCFIWTGSLFTSEGKEPSVEDFITLVKQGFFETDNFEGIKDIWQNAGEETEKFFDYFK